MQSGMYVESQFHDEECDAVLPMNPERHWGSRWAPWLGVSTLCVVVYNAHLFWSGGQKHEHVMTEAVGLSVDLRQSKIRIPIDVLGVDYCNLGGAGDKTKFRTAVSTAIGTQAGVVVPTTVSPVANPSFEGFQCSTTPKRTEFTVQFDVPVEISAAALVSRLNDGRKLRKAMQDELVKQSLGNAVSVLSQIPQVSGVKQSLSTSSTKNPPIILDLDIKGMKYAELLGSGSQQSFAEAVQKAIASGVSGLKPTSIGLDITNGLQDASKVWWIHVTANIPAPAGLSADETMSQWPGGPDEIGKSLQTSLQGLAGIEAVTGGTAGASKIQVYPGALHLGALRQVYTSQFTVEFEAKKWDNPGTSVSSDLQAQLLKSLALKGQIDPSDVKVTRGPIGALGTPLTFTAVVSMDGATTISSKSAWETSVLAAVKDSIEVWNFEHPPTAPDKFALTAQLPFASSYQVSSVDVDMVIHGIDYSELTADKKPAFLKQLVSKIRVGVNSQLQAQLTAAELPTMHVTVSEGQLPGAVDVTVQVPRDSSLVASAELTHLQKNLDNVYSAVATEVKKVAGLEYFSAWTMTSIQVTAPGAKVKQ